MTGARDLGLRFIVEPSGPELSPSEARILSDLRPAGIMLRKRNFRHEAGYSEWREVYARLLSDVRVAIGRPSIVVSVDHEGGNVHRFPPPITRFPYPSAYAASDEAVEAVHTAMAEELRSLGINLSFSPVADIHSNPSNPVINERAFGRTAETVAHSAKVCARALRKNGIVPCAKHFPGHGDTEADSHYALPVLIRSLEELERRELIPFGELIADGIEMIMSAHLMVPAIDPACQATISRAVLTTLLRERLGFKGVTIADALGMKAIYPDVMSGTFASRAHAAGLDLFLMVGDTVTLEDAVRIRDEFAVATASGALSDDSLGESESRISRFLESLPQYSVMELSAHTLQAHADLAARLSKLAPWSSFDFSPVGFD